MKKKIVLIVLLLLVSSLTLLAQVNKTDTTASKNGDAKPVASHPAQDTTVAKNNNNPAKKAADDALKLPAPKKQADSIAAVKTVKPVTDKTQKDTVTSAKTPAQKITKDTVTSAKALPITVGKPKVDITPSIKDTSKLTTQKPPVTTLPAKKDQEKKNKKTDKKSVPDSLSTKVKPKSAKELKREAKKNDINNWSEKDLANMAFKQIGSDSSIKNSKGPLHSDISFTNARPFMLDEPSSYFNLKFFHRYWRDIDLQDPRNKQFASHHADLINALLAAIKSKQITAYNPASITPDNPGGDAFTVPIPYDQLMSGLSDTSVVNILDKDGNITGTKTVPNPFTPEKISGYRIKEDVFYDKTRARTVTRIIGIAPLIKLTLSSGEVINIQPLCWLRFKDCRKVLVTIDIDPSKKVGNSMDDIFLQRRFYGRIVQESNPEGKRIKDYKTEVADQEAEALRMEKKIAVFKKGSWEYTMLTPAPASGATDKPAVTKKVKVKAPVQQAKPTQP